MNEQLTKRGTIGGVLTVVLANITTCELTKTALLAAAGSVVSVIVSVLLKSALKAFSRNVSQHKED